MICKISLWAILVLFIIKVQSGSIDAGDGKFLAVWEVDTTEQVIVFDITVLGTGYVGLGISKTNNMTGADLYICGYFGSNGTTYGWDMHGYDNRPPIMDQVDNYQLIHASENETHTTVQFSRPLNTMDTEEDMEITDSVQYILWSIGEFDMLIHHAARGVVEINLLS